MKKSEINDHIRKYILPDLPGYYVDQYVIYKTFADGLFIKGYVFYSKGDNELGLKVSSFVMPLYVKFDRIVLNLGDDLFFTIRKGLFRKTEKIWWDTRKEIQSNTFEQIKIAIQKQGEPIFNKINSAKKFYDFYKSKKKDNIRIYEPIAYATILFKEIHFQDKMLKGLIREAEDERDIDWVHQIKADAQLLLNTKSQEGRLNILKSWANETLSHLRLPHLKPVDK